MDRDRMPTTQSIERVSGRSQEREFSMQRQGDKINDFGTYSTAETAQTKKPGTHVLDNSDVLRASLSHHNYREWVVADAVRLNQFPRPNSPLTGKTTGKFAISDSNRALACRVATAKPLAAKRGKDTAHP